MSQSMKAAEKRGPSLLYPPHLRLSWRFWLYLQLSFQSHHCCFTRIEDAKTDQAHTRNRKNATNVGNKKNRDCSLAF